MVTTRAARFRYWFAHVFHWWLLAVVPIHLGLISYLSQYDLGIFRDEDATKRVFELIHPAVLVGFTLVSLQGYRLTRSTQFGWLTLFGAVLFCRELHFFGSGPILVGGLLMLLWAAVRQVEERRSFLAERWPASLFTLSFVSYVISQLLDRGVFQFSIQTIRGNPHWILLHRSNMEESLETLGGCFLLLTALCLAGRRRSGTAPSALE